MWSFSSPSRVPSLVDLNGNAGMFGCISFFKFCAVKPLPAASPTITPQRRRGWWTMTRCARGCKHGVLQQRQHPVNEPEILAALARLLCNDLLKLFSLPTAASPHSESVSEEGLGLTVIPSGCSYRHINTAQRPQNALQALPYSSPPPLRPSTPSGWCTPPPPPRVSFSGNPE